MINQYLQRLHFGPISDISFKTLAQIHEAQVKTIPLGSVALQMGIPLSLDLEKIFQKVIIEQRDSLCYEINYLFYHLLKSIGFECSLIQAQLFKGSKITPMFDHLLFYVKLGLDKYLCDAACGEIFLHPLLINEEIQVQANGEYQIKNQILYKKRKDEFSKVYKFDLQERNITDFQQNLEYHQHNPYSFFHQKTFLMTYTNDGYQVLIGNRFHTTDPAGKEKQEDFDFAKKAEEVFGVKCDNIVPLDKPIVVDPNFEDYIE